MALSIPGGGESGAGEDEPIVSGNVINLKPPIVVRDLAELMEPLPVEQEVLAATPAKEAGSLATAATAAQVVRAALEGPARTDPTALTQQPPAAAEATVGTAATAALEERAALAAKRAKAGCSSSSPGPVPTATAGRVEPEATLDFPAMAVTALAVTPPPPMAVTAAMAVIPAHPEQAVSAAPQAAEVPEDSPEPAAQLVCRSLDRLATVATAATDGLHYRR